jgi:hypothetical protein
MMAEDRTQEWAAALERDGRVEISLRKGRVVLLLLICLAFVLIGLALAFTGDATERVYGGLAAVLFGIGLYVFPRQLMRRGPALVVDQQGLTVPQYDTVLPWSAAHGTQVFTSRGTSLVQIEADPGYLDEFYRSHRIMGLARGMNRRLTRGVDCLSLPSPLKADAYQLAFWLDAEIRKRNPGQL